MVLVLSDATEVQVVSAHCLARFAAWQGVAQHAICTPDNADVSRQAVEMQKTRFATHYQL